MAQYTPSVPAKSGRSSIFKEKTAKLSRHNVQVTVAFALVYFFWGSTYFAIRIGVEHVPAALLTGIRFLTAGVIMLLWCALTGKQIALNRHDAVRLYVISLLLLSGGNSLLVWAESFIPSGLAALIVAIVPLWIIILEALVPHGERLKGLGSSGIVLGILGLVVLLWPQLTSTTALGRRELSASLVLMFGSFCWAAGSIISRRSNLSVGPFVATGWEMTMAGATNFIFGIAWGEHHRANWSASGILAILYLIVFGSWVGFTAYIWLLDHVPTPKVATYAYVNPVVAVFLGWFLGHERLDRYMIAGMIVIIFAVVLVTISKMKSAAPATMPSTQPCETGD